MTKQQLKELEEWCAIEGYKREKGYPIKREDWRWSKATTDEKGDWHYISCFLIYDYGSSVKFSMKNPYGATHYVIACGKGGSEYHLSHSIDWGKDNLEDQERMAREFYEFVKEK